MTDYELFALRDIKTVCLSGFTMTTVREFNERHAHGNPIVADDDDAVWFYHNGPFTVTICECGFAYCCEVTNDESCKTGLFQAYADTQELALLMTASKIIMV